jgi:hypothetical protein
MENWFEKLQMEGVGQVSDNSDAAKGNGVAVWTDSEGHERPGQGFYATLDEGKGSKEYSLGWYDVVIGLDYHIGYIDGIASYDDSDDITKEMELTILDDGRIFAGSEKIADMDEFFKKHDDLSDLDDWVYETACEHEFEED